MDTNSKSHIEQLAYRFRNEKALIRSGAVFSVLQAQILPISNVAIAAELEISTPLVDSALWELERDGLAIQTFKGDWEAGFRW